MLSASIIALAQAESQLPLGIALTLAGMLIGGALVFGAMRENVSQLKAVVEKLTSKVDDLTTQVSRLSTAITVMQAVDAAVSDVTAKHEATNPGRDREPPPPPTRRDRRE